MAMTSLKILDNIRIASPCDASWDEMPGDDRVRSCSACSRSVYNIAAMTSDEVSAMIAGREGRLCVRLYLRTDGTVITADCPPTVPPAPGYRFRRAHALALVLVALVVSWTYSKPGADRPSGAGVTWDDWVHWAAVSLGVRPAPIPPPIYQPPPQVITGDMY